MRVRLVVKGPGKFFVFPGILCCVETGIVHVQPVCSYFRYRRKKTLPFFCRCHGVYRILAEEVVVPRTGSNGKNGGSGTGGIEGNGRRGTFRGVL